MAPKIERVTEGSVLGEGPYWDTTTQTLYFVDLVEKTLNKYNPSTKQHTKVTVDEKPSFIIPVEGKKDQFLIPLGRKLVIVKWDGKSDQVSVVEKLAVADDETAETADNTFNDGKCDSSGRLWAGTLNITLGNLQATPAIGTLYSFGSDKKLKAHVNKIRLSNGIAFNDQIKKMYYIDSLKGTVDQYDFDIKNGILSNGKPLFTLEKHDLSGVPDGMTIDTDGNLWVAIFGGGQVIKIDSTKPETLLETLEIPGKQVTCPIFGGKNLDELYVTTASIEDEGETPPPPVNGGTYRITGTGAKGFPPVHFKLN